MVYVGAVMVLFLFVVMMLDINLDRLREGFWSYLPVGALMGILMLVEMVMVLGGSYFGLEAMPAPPAAAETTATRANSAVCFTPTTSIRSSLLRSCCWSRWWLQWR
jgi:NADH-quinone oxidoreductase subunit J